jgi:hypothetical protein
VARILLQHGWTNVRPLLGGFEAWRKSGYPTEAKSAREGDFQRAPRDSPEEVPMKSVVLNIPTFAFIVSTRAALAAGVGLLVSEKFSAPRRRTIGAALVAVGAVTTIPAVISVARSIGRSRQRSSVNRDERLIGARRFSRKGDDDVI